MTSSILNLFLLILGILLDFSLDIGHKDGRFSEILPKKSLEFVSNRWAITIIFNLGLILLPMEVYPIPEESGRKRNALKARGTGCV